MYNLMVTVYTPVHEFEGTINDPKLSSTKEVMERTRDDLEKAINGLTYMVIYHECGSEIALPGELIKNSAFVFWIEEVTSA